MKENAKKQTKWYIHWPKESFCRIIITDSSNGAYQQKHVIAQVAKRHRFAERNARLIAAAPEMYALLERLSHALFAEDADEWSAEIKSLLVKANGGLR